jgi:hypothetical protein
MSNRPIYGYPDAFGAHHFSVFPHSGPASYTQMTDTPVAGGDTARPAEAGMKRFDWVGMGLSDSGTYRVEGVCPAASPSDEPNGGQAASWVLRWVVIATGAEAANALDLSAETVRLAAVGRY